MLYAAMLTRYGPPDMPAWSRVAPPGPGPGQIRIRVHAAEVSPANLKIRRRDLRLEASSCSVQELTALDTDQSSHGPRVP
jgi:NADPH:quinone reductase-like Zn-dependent oxidoreductase